METLRALLKALAIACACGYATFAAAQGTPGGAPSASDVLPDDAQALLNRLGTLTAEEDAGEAARLAGEIEERWTHSGSATLDLLLTRGRDAIGVGELERALAHLTALTDHAPDFAEGWNQRATAFFLMDRYGEALSDLEQALILEPRHFGALAGLGVILERLGEDGAALRAFRAAAQVYPTEENIRSAIERLEAQSGERTL